MSSIGVRPEESESLTAGDQCKKFVQAGFKTIPILTVTQIQRVILEFHENILTGNHKKETRLFWSPSIPAWVWDYAHARIRDSVALKKGTA